MITPLVYFFLIMVYFFKEIEGKPKPKKKPKVFLSWVKKRIENNKNVIIMFNGGTGSGKSFGCIELALLISKMFGTSFSIKGNLAFTFQDLLKKMKGEDNQEPGTVFIMEEVGAFGSGAAAREWQSKVNRFFFSFLQTSRHRNQILILNCPSFSYLEKGSRELVHFQFESLGIDFRKKLSYFKPFAVQVNRRTGQLFFKYLRYRWEGTRKFMNRMEFKLPPQPIINEYERVKLAFTTALNASMEEDGVQDKDKVNTKPLKNTRRLTEQLHKAGNTTKDIARC